MGVGYALGSAKNLLRYYFLLFTPAAEIFSFFPLIPRDSSGDLTPSLKKGRDKLAPFSEETEADTEVPAAAPNIKLGTGMVSFCPNKVRLGLLPNSAPNQPALACPSEQAKKAAVTAIMINFFIIKTDT
jgi:hypothetical protein